MLGEPEEPALRQALEAWPMLVSSRVLIVESMRACARYGEQFAARADSGLPAIALLPIDDAVLRTAATLTPPGLRSLDAVHLATALSLGHRLGIMICYDERLGATAQAAGVQIIQPR